MTFFVSIKERILDNWQMRQVRTAIASPKKEKSVEHLNEKILSDLLDVDLKPVDVKAALKGSGRNKTSLVTGLSDPFRGGGSLRLPKRATFSTKVDCRAFRVRMSFAKTVAEKTHVAAYDAHDC